MSGWRDIARALLLVCLLATWSALSDRLYEALDADRAGSPWRLPLILLGTVVTYAGVVWLGCVVWGKSSLRELGWRFEGWPCAVGAGLLLTLIEGLMVYGAYAYMAGREGVASLTAAIISLGAGERLFFFVMGAKVAFVEETLFRGDLLRALCARLQPAFAVIGSSVVFALYHCDLTPLPLLMKLLFGAVASIATLRMRALLPAMISHTLLWTIFADN